MGLITLHKWTKEDKPVTEKKCGQCGKVKPLEDFPSQPKNRDGKYSYCSPCATKKQAARYKKKREHKEGFFNPNEPMF